MSLPVSTAGFIRPQSDASSRPGPGSRRRSPRSPSQRPRRTSCGIRRRLPGRGTAGSACGLPAMFALMYHELALAISVALTTSFDVRTHCVLRLRRRFDRRSCLLRMWSMQVGDPLDMLLDRHRHVRQHRRALRTGDREQVREAGDRHAEVGVRAVLPFLVQRPPPRPLVSSAFSGPVSASKPVANTMMSSGYSLPPARMPFSVISSIGPSVLRVDQQHVVLVEGLEVVGVERLALGAVGVGPSGSASRRPPDPSPSSGSCA